MGLNGFDMYLKLYKKDTFELRARQCLVAALIAVARPSWAIYPYNSPPAGDRQFAACVKFSNKYYDGGLAASPVKGQSKSQAFCTCLWNETPDGFTGNLALFAESVKGKKISQICEKHADWVG